MSWSIWKQKIRYHYKKYIAITLSSVAMALMIASFALEIVASVKAGSSSISFSFLWNFAVYVIVYSLILIGNIQGTYLAYNGVLGYVFMVMFDAGISLFFRLGDTIVASLSANPTALILTVFYFLCFLGTFVTGLLTYIRIRGYLQSRYASYIGLRNWCLVFMIFSVLLNIFQPTLYLILGVSPFTFVVSCLLPVSEAILSVAIYFTILRLKSEY